MRRQTPKCPESKIHRFFIKKQQQQILKVSNHFVASNFKWFPSFKVWWFFAQLLPLCWSGLIVPLSPQKNFFFGCWERFECFSLPLLPSSPLIPFKKRFPKRRENQKEKGREAAYGHTTTPPVQLWQSLFPLYVQGFPPHSPQGFPFQRQNVQIFLVRIKNTNYCAGEIIGSLLPPPSFCTTVR